MKNASAVNTFEGGIVSDLNPVTTSNNILINCLNGTLVTYNGNEGVLQNDMGNGRVHTAYLPEGYIPLGTAELGGIIYIVSYNPLIKKCQIGSFPSPQRNIAVNSLIKDDEKKVLNCNEFYRKDNNNPTQYVITNNIKVLLTDDNLNPGDKFCINCKDIIPSKDEQTIDSDSDSYILSAYGSPEYDINALPRQLKLHVVSVQDDGKIIYLDDNLVWYHIEKDKYYYINNQNIEETPNIPEFRNLIEGNYNIFNTKQSGKLAILAELEAINTFDVEIIPSEITDLGNGEKQVIIGFNFNWTYENPNPESRPLINPEGIHILPNSPKSLKLSKDIIDISFTEDNVSKRKNDGSDPPVKIDQWKSFTYNLNKSNFLDLDLMPTMKYGHLEYLKRNIQIDLNKLGTGITELIQYKYFAQNTLFNFSYGIASYPEYGKQVNGCKIEFYPFNQDIYDKIKLYENRMDNDYMTASYQKDGDKIRLNSNGWKNNPKYDKDDKPLKDFIDQQPNKIEYTIENNSNSLFGYYEEIINYDEEEKNGLCKDKCYLAKIIINYNNEEARVYYRILYTCDIFNTEYYNNEIKDFKDLVLSEYLKPKTSYQIKENNIKTNYQVKNKDGELIEIHNYIEESQIIDYYVQTDFDTNMSIDISLTSRSNLFKINIQGINEEKVEAIKVENTSSPQYIESWNLDSNKIDTKKVNINSIQSNINNGIISKVYKFTNNVLSPIQVNYNKIQEIPIKYELTYLTMDTLYILGNAAHTWFDMNISKTFSLNSLAKEYLSGDDNIDIHYSFGQWGSIGTTIEEQLKKNDCIALVCGFYRFVDGGVKGQLSYCNDTATNYVNLPDGQYKACTVFFSFKSDNGVITLLPIRSIGSDNSIAPRRYGSHLNENTYGKNASHFSSVDNLNKLNEEIKDTIKDYIKLIDYNGTNITRYSYKDINYWNNFLINHTIQDNTSYNTAISIDKVNLDKHPINNLKWESIQEGTIVFHINQDLKYNSYINQIMSMTLPNFIKNSTSYEEGKEFVQIDQSLSKKYLYIIDGLHKLKPTSLWGNYITSRIDNNNLIIQYNTSPVADTTMKWRAEEQGHIVENIKGWYVGLY